MNRKRHKVTVARFMTFVTLGLHVYIKGSISLLFGRGSIPAVFLGFLVPLRFHEDQQELMATAHKTTLHSELPGWTLRRRKSDMGASREVFHGVELAWGYTLVVVPRRCARWNLAGCLRLFYCDGMGMGGLKELVGVPRACDLVSFWVLDDDPNIN